MNQQDLEKTAKEMVASGKGLLAADESDKTCQKRFDSVGVECTEETRREYRNILITTPNAVEHMSGIILFE
jgi:fructose-bisphosphate aldolase class I